MKQTEWIYRVALIVEASDQDAANDLATKIFPNGEAERGTFSVPMNADGDSKGKPTHYGAYGVLTLDLFEAVKAAVESVVVPSLRFFAEDAGSGKLLQAGDAKAAKGADVVPAGKKDTPWTWDKVLGEVGLKTVAVSDIAALSADAEPAVLGNEGIVGVVEEELAATTAQDGAL